MVLVLWLSTVLCSVTNMALSPPPNLLPGPAPARQEDLEEAPGPAEAAHAGGGQPAQPLRPAHAAQPPHQAGGQPLRPLQRAQGAAPRGARGQPAPALQPQAPKAGGISAHHDRHHCCCRRRQEGLTCCPITQSMRSCFMFCLIYCVALCSQFALPHTCIFRNDFNGYL